MKQRIITALILAPLVVLGIFELPLPLFIVAMAAVMMIGYWEWTQFVNAKSRALALIPAVLVSGISLLLVPLDVFSLNQVTGLHYGILAIGCVWWLISSMLAITYPNSSSLWQHSRILRHTFGMLTLLPFFWSVLLLRAEGMESNTYHGAKLVLYVCFIVWAADSGAYFTGRFMGKHKMAPHVSPNKTIEGLLGGIIIAILIGWGTSLWFDIEFSSPGVMILITLITVIISVLGDLVESMFKRVSGIKDSSNIIPGHGGVLDRIDSLTAAFPVFAFLYFIF